mgnify:FL=1|jgi:hypothetical protein|tara:strand:- start:591 stop:800 length:210 start_codon:yes stop_codon:yes gene_type:complete
MKSAILVACLSPILIIWIILKVSVWLSAVNEEQKYVAGEPFRKRGPYVANPYADVDEEEEEFTDRTDYR